MREKPLILLVDDEDMFLEIASIQLAPVFNIEEGRSFEEAIEKAEEFLPDLILSDMYMPPGPNGWELALAILRNEKTKNIRIAFFTSLRDPWMEIRRSRPDMLRELGTVTFISKIDDVGRLADRVGELLQIR